MRFSPCRLLSAALLAGTIGLGLGSGCQRVPDEYIDDEDDVGPGPLETPPPMYECNPGPADDCPVSQKCAPVIASSGWTLYTCVADDGVLDTNDPCVPDRTNGQDRCRAGTTCILPTGDASLGACLPMCKDAEQCATGLCTGDTVEGLLICADRCDPLAPVCEDDLECVQESEDFMCKFAAESYEGVHNSPCSSTEGNGCGPGLACISSFVLIGCRDIACCTPLCDLRRPDSCDTPNQCREFSNNPVPGYEHLGACYIPG